VPVRYFFNLINCHEAILDEDGIELADDQAAIASALETIQELRSEDPSQAHVWPGWRLEITDSSTRVVERIPLDRLYRH
jgi:hypothetical protein